MVKRVLDLVLTVAMIPMAAPVGVMAALVICIADGRPVSFVQERVGLHRRPFRIFKLRTMRDGRVTGIGSVLRATGLDELPQLIHVLNGDMSLVGPRPLTQDDVVRLGWERPHYDRRWSIRPGIVGPAQLHTAMRCHARISWVFDRDYVQHHCVRRDLGMLAAAALCAVLGKRTAARIWALSTGKGR